MLENIAAHIIACVMILPVAYIGLGILFLTVFNRAER
jgi:hypothetical protein